MHDIYRQSCLCLLLMKMDCLYKSLLIAMFSTMLTSSTKGTIMTVVVGDKKVIQWTLDPLPQLTISVVLVLHPLGEVLFTAQGTDVIFGGSDLGERVSNTGNTNAVTGHIEFTLNGIRMEDAGDYKARYSNKKGITVAPIGVTLVVYAQPSTPIINEISPPVNGTDLILSCMSQSNSKPDNHDSLQMTYIWYRNGADLPSEDRYVTSGSKLQVKNIQKTDRDTVFTCKAYETVSLTSDVSPGYSVVVQYGPVDVFPDLAQNQSLVENKDILGPVTCSADCEPACTYQWQFNGQDYGSQVDKLTINNIQRTSAGTYWCVASNVHGTGKSKSYTVTVFYGPKVTTISPSDRSYTRVEVTSNLLGPINCTTDCYPECSYRWFRDGQVVRTSDVLTLTNITRSDKGRYLCGADNAYGEMNSTAFALFVEYGPDPLILSPPTTSYTLRENVDNLNEIICTSSGNPVCSYSWERDSNQVANRQVLNRANNIKRSQAGQYMCKVTNKHGKRETNITVVVQYAPDEPVLSINSNSADVRETLPIAFQCTTQSVPSSKMILYRENLTTLTTTDNTISITHTIPHANCLDTGLFYCSAENFIGNSTSEGKYANVLCKPRPDHRVSHKLEHILEFGESMNISGTLISNPPPTINWTLRLDGSDISTNLTNNTDNFVVYNFHRGLTIISQAIRTEMDGNDFGEYVMHAYNDYGISTISFSIVAKRKPFEPTLLSILCQPKIPVHIAFAPNFDGGDIQVFSIGMRSASSSVYKKVGNEFIDNKENVIMLSGPIIESGTLYFFKIIASNAFGTTESTSHLNCSIKNDIISPESNTCEDVYIIGIAMIVIGSVALFAGILFVICSHCRQKRTEKLILCPKCSAQLTPNKGLVDKIEDSKSQYEDIGQLTENGQSFEMGVSRDCAYEGLRNISLPVVYEKLNRSNARGETPEAPYQN